MYDWWFGTVVLDSVPSEISYTGIDPDKDAVAFGRQADQRLKLLICLPPVVDVC